MLTTVEFLLIVLSPLLLTVMLGGIFGRAPKSLTRSLSVLAGAMAAFTAIWLFVAPVQGFLYRFQIPALAAAILVVLVWVDGLDWSLAADLVGHIDFGGSARDALSAARLIALVLLLSTAAVSSAYLHAAAVEETTRRTQGDRVVVGKALAPLADGDYRMFVTESGAVPYYSEWHAVDEWGLNSEEIAHEGLDEAFLERYDPDLALVLSGTNTGMIQRKSRVTASFLDNSSYRLVAVIPKQNADRTNVGPRIHSYFVDTESPGYRRIACALLTIDLVYANRTSIATTADIDVRTAEIDRADCRASGGNRSALAAGR